MAGAALVLVGCSALSSGVPGAPSDPLEVETAANRVFVQIYGDAQQREAGNYLSWIALNEDYWSCMEQRGVEPVKHFSPLWTSWTPNATSGTWMGAVQVKPSLHALGIAASSRDESEPSETSAEYAKVSDACQVNDQDMTVGGGPGTPEGAAQLLAEFKELITSVDAQLGPIQDYRTCMAEAGINYSEKSDGDEGWQGLYMFLTASMPKAPIENEKPSPAWNRYLDLETTALNADERCRADKYQQGLALLGPELSQFAAGHDSQLRTLAADWTKIVQDAREKGFTG
ncbi:MAG: hypothetical protein QM779_00800 [Propionicimonas sp.]|uniref:hypothetical protein n=1 Tax=Propionicimonas sp. TaxID=1955623 RepID=UPI003D0C7C8C